MLMQFSLYIRERMFISYSVQDFMHVCALKALNKRIVLVFTISFYLKKLVRQLTVGCCFPGIKGSHPEGFVCSGHLPIRRYRIIRRLVPGSLSGPRIYIPCSTRSSFGFFLDRLGYLGEAFRLEHGISSAEGDIGELVSQHFLHDLFRSYFLSFMDVP